jgi:hypothetical protein
MLGAKIRVMCSTEYVTSICRETYFFEGDERLCWKADLGNERILLGQGQRIKVLESQTAGEKFIIEIEAAKQCLPA